MIRNGFFALSCFRSLLVLVDITAHKQNDCCSSSLFFAMVRVNFYVYVNVYLYNIFCERLNGVVAI